MDGPLTRSALPGPVTIREVGPRDGLQAERPIAVEDRVRLIEALARTGLTKIEAVSFVSATAVPAMAGAAEVWARVRRVPDVAYSALVPNRRGAAAAVEAGGFASLQAFLAASDGYNTANVGKSVAESLADVGDVIAAGLDAGIPVEVSISAAFGDPYEGDVDPARVTDLAAQFIQAGAAGISLGDTTGMATPGRIRDMVERFARSLFGVRLNLHLHDTRGTAMANALAALEAGVTELDASVGGLGGSPFAPGGGNGNLPTEDIVAALEGRGVRTGIDPVALTEASTLAGALVGRHLS